MPSNINDLIPVAGTEIAAEPIQQNFGIAKSEITQLQTDVSNRVISSQLEALVRAILQNSTLAGSNVTITTNADGTITISATGGGGASTWGSITGTLSDQIDLIQALNAKQATLVSGTNIKTINGISLLGSENIVISGGDAGGSALPTLTTFSTSIPLDSVKYSSRTNITGATAITQASGALAGGYYFVEFIANGTNIPTVPSEWVQANSASNFVNTNGNINLLFVYSTGSTTIYSWTNLGNVSGGGSGSVTTLQALGLSSLSFNENSASGTLIGNITGKTTGSTIAINPTDNRVALNGGQTQLLVGTQASTAGTFDVTLVESLAGATNTPRSTTLTLTVNPVVVAPTPFLDNSAYSAVNGFSLIQAKTGQTQCIRVRRSSDNTEQDIGFTNGLLNETSLLSFVGTGATDQGYVVTWYNSAGSNHATQSTLAAQPRIVVNGAVYKEGAIASILFEGAQRLIVNTPPITDANNYTIWATCKFTGDPSYLYGQDSTTNASIREATLYYAGSRLISRDTNGSTTRENRSAATGYLNAFMVLSARIVSGAAALWNNNTNVANLTQIVSSVDSNRAQIGGFTTVYFSGSVSEILFADSASTAYFDELRANRVTGYGIV